jgi:hypothetical protein
MPQMVMRGAVRLVLIGLLSRWREVGKFSQAPGTGGCSVERRGKPDREQEYAPKNEQKYR